jgi:hypothetical protein
MLWRSQRIIEHLISDLASKDSDSTIQIQTWQIHKNQSHLESFHDKIGKEIVNLVAADKR